GAFRRAPRRSRGLKSGGAARALPRGSRSARSESGPRGFVPGSFSVRIQRKYCPLGRASAKMIGLAFFPPAAVKGGPPSGPSPSQPRRPSRPVRAALVRPGLRAGRAGADEKAADRTPAAVAPEKSVPETVEDLKAIQDRVKAVLKRVVPATVGIRAGGASGS